MARPAPRDDQYPPQLFSTFSGTNGAADADLTATQTHAPYAACQVVVTNVDTANAQIMVVQMQGQPTTDVNITIGPGATVPIRGAFVTYRQTSNANIRATFGWAGGPA